MERNITKLQVGQEGEIAFAGAGSEKSSCK